MVQFWVGMRRLTAHWKPLILFEILWKLVTLLVIAPACAGLIQLAIQLAKLKYLTTSNLLQFLRSPWTILLLADVLLRAGVELLLFRRFAGVPVYDYSGRADGDSCHRQQ